MSSVRRVFDLEITAGSGYLKKQTQNPRTIGFWYFKKLKRNCQVT
jgi:hypothetical protein